ncbi:MAG: Fic family protein [Gaiellaceae bacterium]
MSSNASSTAELASEPQIVERLWQPSRDDLGSRRDRQAFTFEAYVPRAIASAEPRLEASVVSAISEAEQATRALNADPPRALSLEALARQLLRAEAVASSRIEGLVVSHGRLARAFVAPKHDVAADVVGNVKAQEKAIELGASASAFTLETLIEIHKTLFEGTSAERYAGLIRESQNWIGGGGASPRGADFVPPPAEYVRPALADFVEFINRDDLPPALQAAIAHAQFETIHPFWDGNGRVGRALIHAILRRRGLTPHYVPPVSLVLAGEAQTYIKGLTSYRYGDPEDWYVIFANALATASERGREFAERVASLEERWLEKAGKPRQGSGARKLIEALPAHPVVDVNSAQALIAAKSQESARQAIIRLEEAGVLRPISAGRKRGRIWETVGLFDLLDSFEREIGVDERTPAPSRS